MSEATKLYLVTIGPWWELGVCGVYSTREKAEAARPLFATENDIVEITIDAAPEAPAGMCAWSVLFKNSGELQTAHPISVSHFHECPEWSKCAPCLGQSGPGDVFRVWARDKEHAVEVANERRAELIASGEWAARQGVRDGN